MCHRPALVTRTAWPIAFGEPTRTTSFCGSSASYLRNKGPWRSIDDLEIAVAEYIDWFNHRRLHGEIGLVPPAEFEAQHHHTTPAQHPAPREIPVSIKPGT